MEFLNVWRRLRRGRLDVVKGLSSPSGMRENELILFLRTNGPSSRADLASFLTEGSSYGSVESARRGVQQLIERSLRKGLIMENGHGLLVLAQETTISVSNAGDALFGLGLGGLAMLSAVAYALYGLGIMFIGTVSVGACILAAVVLDLKTLKLKFEREHDVPSSEHAP